MLNSTSFNYIDVLTKAADASWQREELIANNIANVDTPGYKRQDLDFESVLRAELGPSMYKSLDQKINGANMSHLNPKVYTDYASYSYRIDDNNVDIDTENVELASETLKYQALTQSINSEFARMKTVLGK